MRLLLSLLISSFICCIPVRAAGTEPAIVQIPQQVRVLPGGLDDVPVINCNSPEVVQTDGILLSTFPPDGKLHPEAHLNAPVEGRFDLFFHHINNGIKANDKRTLYLGCVVHNSSERKVKLRTLQAASYLSQPDAPFLPLAPVLANDDGRIFSGPGDRITTDFLAGRNQRGWRSKLMLKPGETRVLFVRPIPVRKLAQPLNGRSGLLKLESDGPLYLAMLSSFGRSSRGSDQHAPKKSDWKNMISSCAQSGPRDKAASAPGVVPLIYGRVSGVAKGSTWLTGSDHTPIAIAPGESISYVISTVAGGTYGTGQVQSAPMQVRYPDTAYEAHGNYAVTYDINLPITNSSNQKANLGFAIQTPLKKSNATDSLLFYQQPPERVYFRGTVRFRYTDENGIAQDRLIHLVEKQGMEVPPLITVQFQAHETRSMRLTFLYPPDATPPQVFTISSQPESR